MRQNLRSSIFCKGGGKERINSTVINFFAFVLSSFSHPMKKGREKKNVDKKLLIEPKNALDSDEP